MGIKVIFGTNMISADTIEISSEMLNLIAEIDEFKGAWRLLGRIAPERLQALKRVATIESIGSSTRIEGAKLSDQEVEALLSRLGTHSFRSRDEQEVAGYAEVCEEVFSSYEAIALSENYIKQLHMILLKHSNKDERHRGEYKKFPNNVEAFDAMGNSLGIVFETTSPFDTPKQMQDLVHWTNDALKIKSLHPLLIVGIFIVMFLAIHPFQDGNGRLARILTTLLLLKVGYNYVPYFSLENVIEGNKENYYLALRRTQGTFKNKAYDWTPWLHFFLQTLQKQTKLLQTKLDRENIMMTSLSELSSQILELVRMHGRLKILNILQATNANRNTIKKHLEELVKKKYIKKHGVGKGTWYTLS